MEGEIEMTKLYMADDDGHFIADLLHWMPPKTRHRIAEGDYKEIFEIVERGHQDDETLGVVITFDEEKLDEYGYQIEDIVCSIKDDFAKENIQCICEEPILFFVGGENEDDLDNMLNITENLCDSIWFLNCASSCLWYRNGYFEDVLDEAREKYR